MKFTGTIARRAETQTKYRAHAALIATSEGIRVFSLDGDVTGAAQIESDVARLVGGLYVDPQTGRESPMTPEKVLSYLWDRNSSTTAYSKPSKITANNPEEAAAKLYKKEGQ